MTMYEVITAKHIVSNNKRVLYDHYHNGYEIIFIEDGIVEFTIGNKTNQYTKNDIIFIDNLEKHEMRQISNDYSRYFVVIEPNLFDSTIKNIELKSIFRNACNKFNNSIHISDKHHDLIKSNFDSCITEYENKYSFWETAIINLVHNLFIELFRNYNNSFIDINSNHKFLISSKILEFIDNNYLNIITLDTIASNLHLDKYYLLNIFKEVTGYTIKQYIILKRISYSKDLLIKSDNNITEIAYDSGFNSSSNFIRSFSKHENMTPLKFRNKYKKNPTK